MNTTAKWYWFTPTAKADSKGTILMEGPVQLLRPLDLDDVGAMYVIEQAQREVHAFEDELEPLTVEGTKLPADHPIVELPTNFHLYREVVKVRDSMDEQDLCTWAYDYCRAHRIPGEAVSKVLALVRQIER